MGVMKNMVIQELSLKNFRNYNELDVVFNDKLNIIIGNNAQGKTNILESIYYLSITKPMMYLNEKNIIMKDKLASSISSIVKTRDMKFKLKVNLNKTSKKLFLNNNEVKKHSDFIGKLKVVLFTPDSLDIIKSSPSNRRRFLNIDISQLYNRYINVLNDYNVILKQRNEYLKVIKQGKFNEEYFKILTEKMIDLSILIYDYRKKYIDFINKYLSDTFLEIAGYGNLQIKYNTNLDFSSNNQKHELIDKFSKIFSKEVLYGNTLIGPHRDDLMFCLDDNDLLLYGSQGQLKLAVLSLKLAEIKVFNDICGEYPVLLLDDLFSELDITKRNNVIKYLNSEVQTIITTTDLEKIEDNVIINAIIYKIDNGNLISLNKRQREERDKNE